VGGTVSGDGPRASAGVPSARRVRLGRERLLKPT